ncbi:MAG: PEP-CTERM system histidine kinase PrsK [Candidatus Thiodiazotropha sp. (ex Myrtea spinifera)]|nr:PEP-CTERM system histidine kinase PrsK [Candidatus Thiodiazotropha sp. (ex Myrtea spinifera)]MCU7830519.1 PEP-CTERM system histidine kinase PrsK [Candidatus Thiodiazotropha sp. (ex Myrtea sp. 'scaly one' KF741663)]
MHIGIIGYSFAAFLFLLFSTLLLTTWRGRVEGTYLLVASVVSGCWALSAVALEVKYSTLTMSIYQILEIVKNVVWFTFLYKLLKTLKEAGGQDSGFLIYAPGTIVLVSAGLIVLELLSLFFPAIWGWSGMASLQLAGHLGFAVAGLTLIEQLFRNTRPESRWAVKYLYFGIGLLFSYDFFLYADGLLYKEIDRDFWLARGFVSAFAVPMAAIAAARNPSWSVRVFVSRRVIFHATVLSAAAIYLLVMSAVGYYIKFYGGTWGKAAQVIFFFLAIAILIALLFSVHLRSRLKVFLSKHFFNYKYDYRDEWLRFIDTLSAGELDERLRERVVKAIADIVDSGGGSLWLRDDASLYRTTSQWQSLPTKEVLTENSSIIEFMRERDWIIDLFEYTRSPGLYDNLDIPESILSLKDAWLLLPINFHSNLLGFIVLNRPRSPRTINWEDRDLLKTAAQQAGSYLTLMQTTRALLEANQFEAFNRLSAFVVHDLKNLIAQLELVVKNAERHKHNPEFMDDAVNTIGNAVNKMSKLLAQLRKGRFEIGNSKEFYIEEAVAQAVNELYHYKPKPNLTVKSNYLKIVADKDRFTAIMVHLIKNSQEASQSEAGRIEVTVEEKDGFATIEIDDDGIGMDDDFIENRLFRPFETTKGNAGMGIGVYETREYIKSLNGSMSVRSQRQVGTTFTIKVPLERGPLEMTSENNSDSEAVL